MKKLIPIITLLLLFNQLPIFAQQADTTKVKSIYSKEVVKKSIIPLSLIVVGSSLSGSKFEKTIKHKIRDNIIENFAIPVDDQMQYVPLAEIYIADILGAKSKNHWFDQTKYLAISHLITAGITHSGKFIINKKRPNGSDHSFPSGHSSFSFTNATVLYEEFNEDYPIFSYSGYFLTTTVASLRVINNRHWFSDILVGSGLGILVTRLVYYYEPFKEWNPFKEYKKVSFYPQLEGDKLSINLMYRFN